MAKDMKEFMKDFDSTFSDMFSEYATKKGVASVSTISDLKKLDIDSFKGVKINDEHKQMILSAFRRDGLTAGLLAIRDRNSNFRHSHAEATAEAFVEAGVKQTMFEKYYSMETIKVGMKKLTKKVEDGKVTPEQFFKAATAVAYVADTYDKSKVGIEYLAKFHESAIPHFRGVAQLKKDGTATLKPEYASAFQKLGVDADKLASCISGKELPKDLTHETETVSKIDFNLKNESIQRLTTNGMKQTSYAANQSYSLIVSELMRSKLIDGTQVRDSFGGLTDTEKELVFPMLAMHGEKNIEQVSESLMFKEALVVGAVDSILQSDSILDNLSAEFKNTIPAGASHDDAVKFVREQLIDKVLDAGVSTGAFAADNSKDFLYEISKGCAKSDEINAMFSQVQKIPAAQGSDVDSIMTTASYLYHEGNIYAYKHIEGKYVSDRRFEEIKDEIKMAEESAIVAEDGTLKENGSFVDLSEARVENFAPNSGNALVTAFNAMHTSEKRKEAQMEMAKVQLTQTEVRTQQTRTGLYRSLPQYNEYLKMYQGYFSRFGIQIASASELIASYNMQEQQAAEEVPNTPPVTPPPTAPVTPGPQDQGVQDQSSGQDTGAPVQS